METSMHYPFIYFLYDTNQVLVYKIQALEYITITDVMRKGEWQGFELQPSELFTAFYHEQSTPQQGWSFFVAQEQLHHLVEIINDYIQQVMTTTSAQMVHIVCSESAAGSLRVALAPPKYVIGFPEDLSIGPLWKLDEKRGQAFRDKWLRENINDGMDDFVNLNKLMNTIREIQDIPSNLPIYIWYGHNAEEQCGLRFLLYLLRDKTNEIVLIDTGEQDAINRHWDIELYAKKKLSAKERLIFQQQWESLAQTKDVCRLWLHQQIQAVPENDYDKLIVSTLRQLHEEQGDTDFIHTGTFISALLTRMDAPPNIFFLEYRIRYLVYSGVFELKGIPKSMHHYSVKIRQKTSLA
ncbi:DUF1835 domain-containing protein [Lysinibacillus fusiformis]|uniref:DUF1835 domain-containing protein n=1 Tax=Lysinibacillus fusiformis TaxID=28031 RepID=UPI001967841C|nr:DUF1835 domain-containing protein [Lysinibacillus fusiformis]QSB08786.1 DUF1835 domain-containing protein [Lysinibacillus fusiformis]